MRLCYLWVEQYRDFKDFELSISSSESFSYKKEDNHIEISKNEELPHNFFHKNMSDVTAIVGENGTGKSNCLELICTVLNKTNRNPISNYLVVIETNNKYLIYKSGINEPTNNFSALIKDDDKVSGLNTIFFSNVYDQRRVLFGSSIIKATANNSYGLSGFRSQSKKSNLFNSQIDLIEKYETYLSKEAKINIPKEIVFDISNNAMRVNDTEPSELLQSLKTRINKIINPQNKFIYSLKYLLLIEQIRFMESNDISNDIKNTVLENNSTDSLLKDMTLNAYNIINENSETKSIYNNEKRKESLLINYEFINKLESELDDTPLDIEIYNNSYGAHVNSFKINISTCNKTTIKNLSAMYSNNNAIQIDWIGISSGARAYLTLFSILYNNLKGTRNDALICIDEGDLYLHPKWQMEFFYHLNNLLPKFCSGKIQLILTSHSPFLLTDLPKNCIIALKNDDTIMQRDLSCIETFGANLYDLYSDIFFLDNEVMGRFAFQKLSEVLSSRSKPEYHYDQKEIKKLIKITSDEVIKHQLKKMITND